MFIRRSGGGWGYCLDTVTVGMLIVKWNEIGGGETEIAPGVDLRSIISGCLNFKGNTPGPDSSEALNSYCCMNG